MNPSNTVVDSFPTYRLRKDVLEEFIREKYGQNAEFVVEVSGYTGATRAQFCEAFDDTV